jgi:hypothetical protein
MTVMNISIKTSLMLLLALLAILGEHQQVIAQPADPSGIKPLLEKVQQAYRRADHLSFAVKYLYTDAGYGQQQGDSLLGEIQLDKQRCRMVLDNTESVVTDKYAIRVLDDNKLIYISGKPATAMPDLLNMTDSLLTHVRSLQIREQGGVRIVTVELPPGLTYNRVEMTIDTVTGYLQRVLYSVHTASLVGKEMVTSAGHQAPYQPEGTITVLFSKYEHGRFDDTLFDETKYFTRSAGHFEPAGRYKNYQIFLASSNL